MAMLSTAHGLELNTESNLLLLQEYYRATIVTIQREL